MARGGCVTYSVKECFYTLQGEGYHAGDPPEAFTPDWPDSERTHWQMYEQTSEGTPISPVMESPEALARWLVDNNLASVLRDQRRSPIFQFQGHVRTSYRKKS